MCLISSSFSPFLPSSSVCCDHCRLRPSVQLFSLILIKPFMTFIHYIYFSTCELGFDVIFLAIIRLYQVRIGRLGFFPGDADLFWPHSGSRESTFGPKWDFWLHMGRKYPFSGQNENSWPHSGSRVFTLGPN